MNYQETLSWLASASSFGIKPGLERINAVLEKLDHPETAYKVIHVAGTNGKGSVVAVSYTHLDVYKRQSMAHASRISFLEKTGGSRSS